MKRVGEPIARLTLSVGPRDHAIGRTDAPLTLVEYGDYQCPFCAAALPVTEALLQALGENLRFAYRHFPLTQAHPHALQAAQAAEAVGAQGRFWEYHRILFENQHALEDEDLVRYAAMLDLDTRRFIRELRNGVHAAKVREDFMSGVRSGVNGTPTFFINGMRHDGNYDYQSLLAALTRTGSLSQPIPGFLARGAASRSARAFPSRSR